MEKKQRNRKAPASKKKGNRKFNIKKVSIPILTLFLCILGMAGVEYQSTGSVEQTKQIAQNVISYLGDTVEERAGEMFGWEEESYDTVATATAVETRNVCTLSEIPEYTGEPYVTVNNNMPNFTEEQYQAYPYEYYGDLDWLGRCTVAEAKVSLELMPIKEREGIGSVKPTGWHTVKYNNIDGKYLYNRCHLIGYQLTAENANASNLITGTRYLNVTGMLPWENLVADYIKTTGDYVLYRVTPIYYEDDLVARGVQMEAESMTTDQICFNIFVFNIQPGIAIDYATGDSWLS